MKLIITSCFILITYLGFAQKDSSLNGLFKKATKVFNQKQNGSSLSASEIADGLKEALSIGAQKSADQLSAADGFFKDAAIKILMPQEALTVEKKLRAVGLGNLVDKAILSMNRAAEDASKSAAPIFLSAIKNLTVNDAIGILRGTDTAATSYLRRSTTSELLSAFTPIIETSLQKLNATEYWEDVFTAYNKISFNKVNTDLNGFVTGKAIDGLFYYVATEEKNIRKNPAERVTGLLKKVFGSN
ncbi:MAG: DUF4197 domain-containing protein [Ginsengibacter sp.]